MRRLFEKKKLYSRDEVLTKPCPVPATAGAYASFFREIPDGVPTTDCIVREGKTLLYIGISPDKRSKPHSTQNLKRRIVTHYRGNAEGSTLRRTLGVLLARNSDYLLRRVGSGKRMTLTHLGEQSLDQWMAKNAFVAWIEHSAPWEIEHQILESISCPLNIAGNAHHPFVTKLKRIRADAIQDARDAPIAREDNMARRFK